MHSRIFQISKKTVEDRISEDRYYDDFVGRIADYVDELDAGGQLESIRWLAEATPGIAVKDAGDATATMTIVDKKAYFAGKFEEFENALRELGKLTLEQFATDDRDLNCRMWLLKEAYEETCAFYVDDYDEEFGLLTFDRFMREADEGSVWYIGTVIDYHC